MSGMLTLMVLILAVGGLIYLYARHVGRGDPKAAFEDPHDRKKVLIIGGAIIGLAVVIFLLLLLTKTISF